MFRAGPIGWLSLESLAHQEATDFPWQVLVLEDSDDDQRLGEDTVRAFEPRLRAKGCVGIQYELVPGQPALSLKWRRMGQMLSPDCQVFCVQGCDDYCDPLRLRRTMRLFDNGAVDWIHSRFGVFYDIATRQTALYDDRLSPRETDRVDEFDRQPTGLNMSVRADYLRHLPEEEVRRGVDRWIYRNIRSRTASPLRSHWDEEEPDWRPAIFTQGLNTISASRWHLMRRLQDPFAANPHPIDSLLPAPVLDRLASLQTPAADSLIHALGAEIDQLEAKVTDFRGMKERRDAKIARLEQQLNSRPASPQPATLWQRLFRR